MALTELIALGWWSLVPVIALGALLHFTYEWCGRRRWAALFSAVNESYWEHIKIAFWPVAFEFLVLSTLGGAGLPSFLPAVTIALYSIPVTMVGVVYAYKAVTRRNVLWLDIAAFAIAIVAAQLVFSLLLSDLTASALTISVSAVFCAGICAAFLLFTLRPPADPDLFIDPLQSQYGIVATSPGAADTATTKDPTADRLTPDRP